MPPHDSWGVRCVWSRHPAPLGGGEEVQFLVLAFFFGIVVTAPASGGDAVGGCALRGYLNPNVSRQFIDGGLFWSLCRVASEVACRPKMMGRALLGPSSLADVGGEGASLLILGFCFGQNVCVTAPAGGDAAGCCALRVSRERDATRHGRKGGGKSVTTRVSSRIGSSVPPHDGGGVRCVVPSSTSFSVFYFLAKNRYFLVKIFRF